MYCHNGTLNVIECCQHINVNCLHAFNQSKRFEQHPIMLSNYSDKHDTINSKSNTTLEKTDRSNNAGANHFPLKLPNLVNSSETMEIIEGDNNSTDEEILTEDDKDILNLQ